MTSTMLGLAALLGVLLHSKLNYVSGCHSRITQLELLRERITQNEAAVDVREKAIEAAEAQINGKH